MSQFLNEFIVEHVTVDGTNYILAAGTSDVNSGAVDAANCRELVFFLTLGVMAASSTCDFKIQGSSDGSTGWTDLVGTAATQAVATDDDKMIGASVKNPTEYRYYRIAITRGDGGNTTLQSLHCVKGQTRKQVAAASLQSTSAGQFVAAPEQFVSVGAGTA